MESIKTHEVAFNNEPRLDNSETLLALRDERSEAGTGYRKLLADAGQWPQSAKLVFIESFGGPGYYDDHGDIRPFIENCVRSRNASDYFRPQIVGHIMDDGKLQSIQYAADSLLYISEIIVDALRRKDTRFLHEGIVTAIEKIATNRVILSEKNSGLFFGTLAKYRNFSQCRDEVILAEIEAEKQAICRDLGAYIQFLLDSYVERGYGDVAAKQESRYQTGSVIEKAFAQVNNERTQYKFTGPIPEVLATSRDELRTKIKTLLDREESLSLREGSLQREVDTLRSANVELQRRAEGAETEVGNLKKRLGTIISLLRNAATTITGASSKRSLVNKEEVIPTRVANTILTDLTTQAELE